MTPVRDVPRHRRRLTAVTALAALTLAVAGVELVSSADRAQASGTEGAASSITATTTTAATTAAVTTGPRRAVVPVSVPTDAPFELDVVQVTVTPDPTPVAPPGGSAGPGPGGRAPGGRAPAGSVRDVAAATLAELPASEGVTLLLDRPELAGHLGGVFMGSPGYLLLNAARLAGDADRTRDVVRHEIAHVYQARLAATLGLGTVDRRMVEIFGPGGLERSADCVALALGAAWTHYTTDCGGPDRAAAVEALLAGRMP